MNRLGIFCFEFLHLRSVLKHGTNNRSGYSAVRLAYLLWEQGVVGSNPTTPTIKTRSFNKLRVFYLLLSQACLNEEKQMKNRVERGF